MAPFFERPDVELDEELPVDDVPFESFEEEDELDEVDDDESFLVLAFTASPAPRWGDLSEVEEAALADGAATLAGDRERDVASLDFLTGL